jgi:hypothetical protein
VAHYLSATRACHFGLTYTMWLLPRTERDEAGRVHRPLTPPMTSVATARPDYSPRQPISNWYEEANFHMRNVRMPNWRRPVSRDDGAMVGNARSSLEHQLMDAQGVHVLPDRGYPVAVELEREVVFIRVVLAVGEICA